MSENSATTPISPTTEPPKPPKIKASKHAQFRNLLVDAKVRILYEELLRLSFPVEIRIGSRELGEILGCDKDTVNELRKELVQRGLVKYRVENHQAIYRLMLPKLK